MLLNEEYLAFAAPLRGRPASAIRKLAQSEGITLPNIRDVELLVQELYARKKGLPSAIGAAQAEFEAAANKAPAPTDAGSPAAMPVVPNLQPDAAAGDAGPFFRIVRARRAKYYAVRPEPWTPRPERVEWSAFSDEEWRRLEADAQLIIRSVG